MNNLNDSPDDSLDLESSRLCYNNPRLKSRQNRQLSAASGTLYHFRTKKAVQTAKTAQYGTLWQYCTD